MTDMPSDEVRSAVERIAELSSQGRRAEAIAGCRVLTERFPARLGPRLVLGALLLESGHREEAERLLRECLRAAPTLAPALSLLGELLLDKRDFTGALECFQALSRAQPEDAKAWNNVAASALALGRNEEAEAAARRAWSLDPRSAVACLNVGRALAARGHRDEARTLVRESLRLDPGSDRAHDLEGRLFAQVGAYTRAAGSFRAALAAGAGSATASRLGDVLMQMGEAGAAIGAYRDAESTDRASAAANGSRALFAMHFDEDHDPGKIFASHLEWAGRYAASALRNEYANDRDPDRRLRIGYVSPRFRVSSAAFLLLPVLERHDPEELEFFCYAEQDADDEVTVRIRSRATGWTDTRSLDNEALDEAIRRDAIDIVVDLAGHTPGNRLPALSRKPAPVALTWLDYCDTTGCSAFDAIVTDAFHSPADDRQSFVERRLRLAPLRYCYAPPDYAPDAVPPPSAKGGGVVFGAFHRFAKIGPSVLKAWADLLAIDARSRLVIKNDALGDEGEREHHRRRLAAAGLPTDRVDLRAGSTHSDMLGEYGGVDIALDTFPYNGGVTTLEALFMGRPVVTVEGGALISRQSAAILRSAGLAELIASDARNMVQLAASLAADPVRLGRLSASLRDRLMASPVCDAAAFARQLEAAYRAAWRTWCAGGRIGDPA